MRDYHHAIASSEKSLSHSPKYVVFLSHEGNPPLPLFLNQRRPRLGEISGMERADRDEHLNFPQELLVQKITMADKIPYLSSERSGCERLWVVQGRDSRLRFVRCCPPQFFALSGAAIDGSCSSYQSLALSWVVFAGFSAKSLPQRIVDCKPKMVLTCTAVMRGSKIVYLKDIVDKALTESTGNRIS